MKRHAILIAAPKLGKLKDHPGMVVDVNKMEQWLLSNAGGAWEQNEIKKFPANPSLADLEPYLKWQKDCDYVFNLFAGHGYVKKGEYGYDAMLCLRDREDVKITLLNPGNKRCTIMADSCRTIEIEIPKEIVAESVIRMKRASAYVADRARFRALFDKAVLEAEQGPIYIYSCGVNQSAADNDEDGGLFTFNFLRGANTFRETASANEILSLDKAFEAAKYLTTNLVPQQVPELHGGRRLRYFPFGAS